jgi:hypothetical protein
MNRFCSSIRGRLGFAILLIAKSTKLVLFRQTDYNGSNKTGLMVMVADFFKKFPSRPAE